MPHHPLPMEKGHHCVSVTTTASPSPTPTTPRIPTSLQQRGVLQATSRFPTGRLHQVNQLEHIQRRETLACTHACQKTSNGALLNELGWPTLEQRRYYHKLVMFYKMVSGSAPNYLKVLIQGEYLLHDMLQDLYIVCNYARLEPPATEDHSYQVLLKYGIC